MDWWITFDQQAADYLPDLRIEKEEPMDRHTSFRIGGPARRMAFPERGEQLVLLLDMAARCGARPLVMGNGTNLLAPDEGLDRLVIDTSAGLSRVEAGGTPGTILAEAGASLARVADFACRQGLAGLEFAHGIPGTVGGAVCMNAGAYGGEMAQVVREATLLLSLIHISEPTRLGMISYAVFCLKKFFLMIRRPPRSTLSPSSAASDVYKRQLSHRVEELGENS